MSPSARGPVLSRARAAECVLELDLCALSARRTAPPGGAIAAIGETDRTSDRLPTGTSATAPSLVTTAEPNLNEEAGVGQCPGGCDFGIQKKRRPRHGIWGDGAMAVIVGYPSKRHGAGMPVLLTPAAKINSAAPFCAMQTNQVFRL